LDCKENEAKETLSISVARFSYSVGEGGGWINLTRNLSLLQLRATGPSEQKAARMGCAEVESLTYFLSEK